MRSALRQMRRVLERHWSARIIVVVVTAILAGGTIERGHLALGVGIAVVTLALLMILVRQAPPSRLARLERRAREALPPEDGHAAVTGLIVTALQPLTSPHSKAPCVACWARIVVETGEGTATEDETSASIDFVMRCGDVLLTVEARDAEVLFDPARAHKRRDSPLLGIYEEQYAGVGDRVLVSGHLVHGASDDPHRAAARITRPGRRRVVVGLIAASKPAAEVSDMARATDPHA